ncbi:MAG: T9SS type A sorting domain-containing protein [Candidatus Kapaibacterium sp.]
MKILVTLFFFLLSIGSASAQHPDDYRWDDRFGVPGIVSPGNTLNGATTITLASTSNYVVVGGNFTIPGINIAVWNIKNKAWEKAGLGVWKKTAGNNIAYVNGLYADGDSVFVWGNFTMVDDTIPASNFAILNPRTKVWTADTLINGRIYDVIRYGADIIVSGDFMIKGTTIQNSARWNSGTWSEFNPDTTTIAGSLAVFKGELYSNVKYVNLNNIITIARWDGMRWKRIIEKVEAKSYYNSIPIRGIKATNDYLYVYGAVDSMKPMLGSFFKANNLVRFNGTTWSTLLDTTMQDRIKTISFDGEDVIIAGNFSSVNGIISDGIAKRNNTTNRWSSLGSGIPFNPNYGREISSVIVAGSQVFTAGLFDIAGAQYVNNIAGFNQTTSSWFALRDAKTQAPVVVVAASIFTVYEDEGKLLGFGGFVHAGDKTLNNIGYWTGGNWLNIGPGIIGNATFTRQYNHLFQAPTGFTQYARLNGTMYLGGSFDVLGDYPCENITTYDNGVTNCVGGGVTQSYQGTSGHFLFTSSISSLKVFRNELFAVGNFVKAGNVNVESIAKWDGQKWDSPGSGLQGSKLGQYKLAVDSTNKLLVAGKLTSAGGVACNGLASWDGQKWEAIPISNKDSSAYPMAICVAPNGDVYLAGSMSVDGKPIAPVLLRKRGNEIVKIGECPRDTINGVYFYEIACKGDLLYVTGNFNEISGITAHKVAVWNMKTEKWSTLGSGFVRVIYKDTIVDNGGRITSIAFVGDTVYFGGEFSHAGGKPSFNIAAWLPAKPNSVECIGSSVTTSKLAITPNPASSAATLTFAIPQTEQVTITLRDALGREVLRISESELPAGEYQTQIDCSTLAGGAYYCVLTGMHTTVTKIFIHSK